jgi:tRNA nucleotidyltransferase (CCA-adding enzyme)
MTYYLSTSSTNQQGAGFAMTNEQAARLLMRRLPRNIVVLLRELGRLADEKGVALYLVGGVVRDLLLRRENWDLDLTVEGDGIAFARLVADRYGAGLALFERFATARLTLPKGLKVDIASTRRESYAKPAALPDVQPASLKEDLYRRDFTINAMAIQVNPARFGQLHDPYNGQQDLRAKTIRVLHEDSFIDDPTRIFRAIRFTERFGFHLEPKTRRLLKQAAATDMVAKLSGPRLANEMFLLMQERDPNRAIGSLTRLNLLRFLHPSLRHGKQAHRLVTTLPRAFIWWKQQCPGDPVDRALLGLMALLSDAGSSILQRVAQRLQLSARQATSVEWASEKTTRAVKILLGRSEIRPSKIYHLLVNMPDEALVLLVGKGLANGDIAGVRRLTTRLVRFLKHDRWVMTTVKGEDLKQLGLKPGPRFKTILDRLLDKRLDGVVSTKSEECVLARRLVQSSA